MSGFKDLEITKRELAELFYQFSALYDRWSIEHEQVARREVEFAQILSEFSKQIELTARLGAEIQKNIQTTTSKAATKEGDVWIKVILVGVLVGAIVGFGTAWLYRSEFKPFHPRALNIDS